MFLTSTVQTQKTFISDFKALETIIPLENLILKVSQSGSQIILISDVRM